MISVADSLVDVIEFSFGVISLSSMIVEALTMDRVVAPADDS